jgi:small subunit ribosomal protein S1
VADAPLPVPPAPPVPGDVKVPRPVVHRPKVVSVEVTGVGTDGVEAKLADGRPGIIEARDLAADPAASSLDVGATVEVAVLSRFDSSGRVLLSRRWALQNRAWDRLEEAVAGHEPVSGRVVRQVKGGLVVEVDGLRTFLPLSMVDEHPHPDPASLVGTEIEVLVTAAERDADRIVVSRRDLLRRQRRQAERSVWASLKVGGTVTGRVVGVGGAGAQVELGPGVRGLVHRSELSWQRVDNPGDVVSVGDDVTVEVLDVNRSKRRVGLSLRRLQADPFAAIIVGQRTEGVVLRVVDYGCFVRLDDSGAEGLVHMSELSDRPNMRPDQLVVPGERLAVKVISADPVKRRLGLSVRQALLAE